jgi:methionine synthase II (cobalamin-independent)/2-polyprenyl-6-methoxyphenol hydroxylase-like FAD-dependent oxidoreductase
MDRQTSEDVPVLIVGGSLVGLSAALFLRRYGVGVLAVERHAGTAIHSRAGHFHLRTVEILRSAGLEDAVRRKSEEQYPPDGGINNVESLAGREIANYFPNLNAGVGEFSPTVRLFINQDALEPILRARAEELGARLRYGTECVSLGQDEHGVTAVIRDLATGARTTVRARYVIAADGNRSPAREWLGVGMRGHGLLSHSITIYFRAQADLGPLLRDRNQGVHYVTNSLMRGFFRLDRSGNAGFLVVNLVGDTSRPEIIAAYPDAPWANVAEGITEQRALELLRAAIGVPGVPVVIENIATWHAQADVADRFQDGRVFLAGDAAHVVPPNGGYGGNTGVQDAHNLAWKLALTLAGGAGPGLLQTYDAERRPIGELTVEQAFTRYVTRVAPYLGTENTQPLVDDFSMEIGYRYNSPAVVLEPGPRPLHEHPRESKGRPGGRAPHVWLDRDGTPQSTLDLFGGNFVLLAGPRGDAWLAAAHAAAKELGVALDAHLVGGAFPEAYGISSSGAVVVRPDGFVGWRATDAVDAADAPQAVLQQVLSTLLCRQNGNRKKARMAHVYRADTIGSLLRPPYLKLAREQFEAGQLASAAYKEIEDRAVDQAIAMQEAVGLDVVTDGELRRHTFIDQLTEQVEGLTLDDGDSDHIPVPFHGAAGELVSVFAIPLSVTSKLRRRRMMTVEEYAYARARARRPVKVTLPSPLMLFLVWSPRRSRDAYRDPFELFADGLRLMREEAEELARLGCTYIQVDAPDFGQLVDQSQREAWERAGISVDRVFAEGVDMLNAVAGIPGVSFGLHLCRGNYDSDWISAGAYETISKQLFRRATNYDVFLLEYDDERSGSFSALGDVPDDKVVVLGLVSSKFDQMEPAGQLADRIREASRFFPGEQLALSTQCGFASAGPGNAISEDAQENKLRLVGELANRVWKAGS